jgi:hypothetical protein
MLTALLAPGFAPQTTIPAADVILLEFLAPTYGAAVAVLQHWVAGKAGTQENFDRVLKLLALIKKACKQALI